MPGGLKQNLRDEPVSQRRQCGCSSAAAATSARGTLPLECSAWVAGRHLPSGDGRKTLGHQIATLRRRRGLGYREFAQSVGVSPSTLVALELDRGAGRLATLEGASWCSGQGPISPRVAAQGPSIPMPGIPRRTRRGRPRQRC